MEIGQRLRQARQAAGLSQRQLCGEEITRNMLSQIENGSARPSMDTLRYLAGRLGKPVSYFLEEDAVTSPNQRRMEDAREAYRRGEWDRAAATLADYQGPDPVFDPEKALLLALTRLKMAEQALSERRLPYARELLTLAGAENSLYWTPALERERLLLLAQADRPEAVESALLPDDRELRIRAAGALARGEAKRCGEFLDAALDRQSPDWNWMRGEAYLAQEAYEDAARCYHQAEEALPGRTAPRLEQCYREMGDYQMAYTYARKQLRGQ